MFGFRWILSWLCMFFLFLCSSVRACHRLGHQCDRATGFGRVFAFPVRWGLWSAHAQCPFFHHIASHHLACELPCCFFSSARWHHTKSPGAPYKSAWSSVGESTSHHCANEWQVHPVVEWIAASRGSPLNLAVISLDLASEWQRNLYKAVRRVWCAAQPGNRCPINRDVTSVFPPYQIWILNPTHLKFESWIPDSLKFESWFNCCQCHWWVHTLDSYLRTSMNRRERDSSAAWFSMSTAADFDQLRWLSTAITNREYREQ